MNDRLVTFDEVQAAVDKLAANDLRLMSAIERLAESFDKLVTKLGAPRSSAAPPSQVRLDR